jgi:hypothetical protein
MTLNCVQTINLCFKPNLGGEPQPVGRFFYHSYLCHGITFIFFSFDEKEKKNKNFLRFMCVCEYINSLKKYFMKIIQMSKKVTLKQFNDKKVGLISLNPKPNVPPIYAQV